MNENAAKGAGCPVWMKGLLVVSLVANMAIAGLYLGHMSQADRPKRGPNAQIDWILKFVPEERRGRVSIFMDSYLYCIGVIVGCLFTGVIVLVGILTGAENYFYLYLGLAVLASVFAVWAIYKMRGVYDVSLLNWRLKRRQRRGLTGVMDKLEF